MRHHRVIPSLGDVVLVTGPMGSGKSTLALNMALQFGWERVSEETFWVENGWGSGLRSSEQEELVQRQVIDLIKRRVQILEHAAVVIGGSATDLKPGRVGQPGSDLRSLS